MEGAGLFPDQSFCEPYSCKQCGAPPRALPALQPLLGLNPLLRLLPQPLSRALGLPCSPSTIPPPSPTQPHTESTYNKPLAHSHAHVDTCTPAFIFPHRQPCRAVEAGDILGVLMEEGSSKARYAALQMPALLCSVLPVGRALGGDELGADSPAPTCSHHPFPRPSH